MISYSSLKFIAELVSRLVQVPSYQLEFGSAFTFGHYNILTLWMQLYFVHGDNQETEDIPLLLAIGIQLAV